MVWGRTGIRETAVARVPDFSIAGNDTDTPRRHLEQRGRLLRQLRRSKFQTCSVLPNVHAHRRATAMKKKAPTLHARPGGGAVRAHSYPSEPSWCLSGKTADMPRALKTRNSAITS